MKFLLTAINAKYIHSNPAVYSLRAYANKELEEYIELKEYTINQHMEDIIADIYKSKPDAIGFSCYIWNWNMVREILKDISKLLPDTDIWLGGPEVTYNPEEILKEFPNVLGILIGEGEETFKELVECYLDNGDFKKVAGLCLRDGFTAYRGLTDMSKLPFLYDNLEKFENKIIYYESSRGCPFNCSYCLSSIDKSVRLRDINLVKKELKFFLDNNVKQVKFVDRTFNCNHKHAMAIWQFILDNDNGITNFHFEISADIINDDEIELLRKFRPGLAQLEIGVQSTNEKTIKAINRVMNVDRLEKITTSIREGRNIHQHLDLIAGLPYEDYNSFKNSFNRVYGMKPDQLQLGFLKVLKGSEMESRAKEFGICYRDDPPYEFYYTKWLSYDEVLKLKQIEEMVEIYYNSDQFTHTIAFLEDAFESAFDMYEKMAKYYDENGYYINSPSRTYRYKILLDFIEKYDDKRLDIYKELLTYDLYLREKLKSRPDYLADINTDSYRKYAKDFYTKEEEERRLLPDYEGFSWKQLSKMTHLEYFNYPVWDMSKKEGGYVLFDYKNRNPLNYDARTIIIK